MRYELEAKVRVKTDKGTTECRFEDFAAVEPKVVEIRQKFRDKKLDRDEVRRMTMPLFGISRVSKEWQPGWGIQEWDAWVESQPMSHRKLYYHPDTVAECIMGEDE
jgi:hypothetical protein